MNRTELTFFNFDNYGDLYSFKDGKIEKIGSKQSTNDTIVIRTADGYLPIKEIVGDFGGAFANLNLGTPEVPCMVVAEDTNAVTPAKALFIFFNGSWKQISI